MGTSSKLSRQKLEGYYFNKGRLWPSILVGLTLLLVLLINLTLHVRAEVTNRPNVVQAEPIDPIILPKKPTMPPVKPGVYQGQLSIDGHGGNMVTGETPLSQYRLSFNDTDYDALQSLIAQGQLPLRNSVSSHQLVNHFDYRFDNTLANSGELSKNYKVTTELAPSPFNQSTFLLLVNVELTANASEKAELGFNWLQTLVRFNPRLVSEYRLIGYETNTRVNSRKGPAQHVQPHIKLSDAKQFVALYELRYNEQTMTVGVNNIEGDTAGNRGVHQGFSATTMAELVILDSRAKAKQQLIPEYAIDISQQHKFFEQASPEFRFAAAVAGLGQLINHNHYVHQFNYDELVHIANQSVNELNQIVGDNASTDKIEFLALVKSVYELTKSQQGKQYRPRNQVTPYPMPKPILLPKQGELLEGKQTKNQNH
ncbi:hypothetical protein A9267_06190 [Shewanella sp. UCD-FRSSP16_17]|nr:von Willebrand factor type A domain-containing protein [Shewanella sp. UCD-FRSSP16_17]OBT10457.1 hypothetical protein A9267_06190 [Shewanella sp. UCD-FRSSP16_17]